MSCGIVVAVEACGYTAREVEVSVVEELTEENCLVQGVVEDNVQ
jgi:hypothetical protein